MNLEKKEIFKQNEFLLLTIKCWGGKKYGGNVFKYKEEAIKYWSQDQNSTSETK